MKNTLLLSENKLPNEIIEVLKNAPDGRIFIELEIKDGKIYYQFLYDTLNFFDTLELWKEVEEKVAQKKKKGWTRKDFFDQFRKTQKIIEQCIDE